MESRIEVAAARLGRPRSEITLVAVSKKFSSSAIEAAYACGCRDFGENYVQEFAGKREQLPSLPDARFHLIGHLQSNKARLAAEIFQTIQTVDSVRLVKRIDAAMAEFGLKMPVMLEVKLSPEGEKSGCQPSEIPALLGAAAECSNLEVAGLMTIPPWSAIAESSRPFFRQLASLAQEHRLHQLSMGMSNDLEVAIEEGATHIRVGTALFGARPKPDASASL